MVLLPEVQNARKHPGLPFPLQSLGFSYTSAERESGTWTDRLPLSPLSPSDARPQGQAVFSLLCPSIHGTAAAACAAWESLLEDAGMGIFYFNSRVFIFMFL